MPTYKMTNSQKKFLWFILALYSISWVLPILDGGGSDVFWGFNGATVAFTKFLQGWEQLFFSNSLYIAGKKLFWIFIGAGNIFFVLAAVFLVFRPRVSFYLSVLAFLGMIVWWRPQNIMIGFYVWCVAGLLLAMFATMRFYQSRHHSRPCLVEIVMFIVASVAILVPAYVEYLWR